MNIALILTQYVVVMWLSIVVHEIGHIFAFHYYTNKWLKVELVKGAFCVGTNDDYLNLNTEQYRGVMLTGIIVGAFPLLLLPTGFIIGLMLYLGLGCISDIRNMIRRGSA